MTGFVRGYGTGDENSVGFQSLGNGERTVPRREEVRCCRQRRRRPVEESSACRDRLSEVARTCVDPLSQLLPRPVGCVVCKPWAGSGAGLVLGWL